MCFRTITGYQGTSKMRFMAAICLLIACLSLNNSVQAADKLILGVHPYKSVKKLQKFYQPLVEYLSEKLNINVELSIAKDYASHIHAIGNDNIDIAYMGPASYVSLVNEYGKKRLLARQEINGKTTFKGNIIVRADSNIRTYQDLKNKKFAFGDPNSTMSHLVPRYMLIENGITKNDLEKINFLGSHDNVAISVLAGEFDAGAVKEAIYQKYKSKGIVSFATTPELSEHLFVVSNTLSEEKYLEIKKIMLNMHEDNRGLNILKGIKNSMTCLSDVDDKDYNNLRDILGLLRKNHIIK